MADKEEKAPKAPKGPKAGEGDQQPKKPQQAHQAKGGDKGQPKADAAAKPALDVAPVSRRQHGPQAVGGHRRCGWLRAARSPTFQAIRHVVGMA